MNRPGTIQHVPKLRSVRERIEQLSTRDRVRLLDSLRKRKRTGSMRPDLDPALRSVFNAIGSLDFRDQEKLFRGLNVL